MADLDDGPELFLRHDIRRPLPSGSQDAERQGRQVIYHRHQRREKDHQKSDHRSKAERHGIRFPGRHGLGGHLTEDQDRKGQDPGSNADRFLAHHVDRQGGGKGRGIQIHNVVPDQDRRKHLLRILQDLQEHCRVPVPVLRQRPDPDPVCRGQGRLRGRKER